MESLLYEHCSSCVDIVMEGFRGTLTFNSRNLGFLGRQFRNTTIRALDPSCYCIDCWKFSVLK